MKTPPPSQLAAKIAVSRPHDNNNPLWKGPCGEGPNGGVTQSLLGRFFICRERFQLKYILGLDPHDKWNHRLGYGNMWHVCEEAAAAEVRHFDGELSGIDTRAWKDDLEQHVHEMLERYPFQKDEILRWWNVCEVQFPEYVRYWYSHPDVINRTPLLQEQTFDVPYTLPSGRIVRLRGKWDSVDFLPAHEHDGVQYPDGIWLQENKTKGDVDKLQIERQLKFDLQTMVYLIALDEIACLTRAGNTDNPLPDQCTEYPILGVRYNVVRRPLSGGKGTISPHKAKYTKTKTIPAETAEHFYQRLRDDYIRKEPEYFFFRVRASITQRDIEVFKKTCLDPLLEHLCDWYNEITRKIHLWVEKPHSGYSVDFPKSFNYRTPFGIYNSMSDGGETEYDAYLETGSEVGLRRVDKLFTELE